MITNLCAVKYLWKLEKKYSTFSKNKIQNIALTILFDNSVFYFSNFHKANWKLYSKNTLAFSVANFSKTEVDFKL